MKVQVQNEQTDLHKPPASPPDNIPEYPAIAGYQKTSDRNERVPGKNK